MEQSKLNVAAFPQIALKVITQPSAFFQEMPKTGGFVEPLVFMVVMGFVSAIIRVLFSVIGLSPMGVAVGLGSLIVMPIMVAIFGFIIAAILFVIWKLLGSQESYETAYRTVAYVSALSPVTALLGIIPYLGGALGIALMTLYLIIASVKVHSIPQNKAAITFCIIGAVLILFTVGAEISARKMVNSFSSDMGKYQKDAERVSKEMQKQIEDLQKAAEQMQKQAGQQQQ